MALTIAETTAEIHTALRKYIEAAYHIGDPLLIEQRRSLLDRAGVIAQQPYIESTPKYRSNRSFADLGLDDDVLTFLQTLTREEGGKDRLFYDPPYEHQAQSLSGALVEKKSLLVMTGTGSGKTECFLLPVLGKLAEEAQHRPASFQQPAMRALVLYPMNALVNDQLARLRLIFGDSRVVEQFIEWSRRPVRFARYTSRTLYPGVRDRKKDGTRLKSIESFYLQQLETAAGESSPEQQRAEQLVRSLQERGKWPAKPDLRKWYGSPGGHWQDKQGNFIRAVRQERDSELLTRHEVQSEPADIVVTNYSMLEYMMMRPLERPIFDATRDWLGENPDERFILVVDEAHMYRGASGAEVSLLLRRLRKRLNISDERLQVICTSASFDDKDYAIEFAAELTGKRSSQFAAPVQGSLALRDPASVGEAVDMNALLSVDLDKFYDAQSHESRFDIVRPFLEYRDVDIDNGPIEKKLYEALNDFGPLNELVNRTMKQACPVEELGAKLFPTAEDESKAERAVTVLAALGSLARPDARQPGLLPCRVHAFFRGLPGLWVCMNPDCSALPTEHRGRSLTGAMYSQPRDHCSCGSQVLEFFTCRNCGAAYARAYTNDLLDPEFLWSEPGAAVRTSGGSTEEFEPLDLLLEYPLVAESTDLVLYDLVTGQINPSTPGDHVRDVYLSVTRSDPADKTGTRPGQFRPCAMCGSRAGYGRSSVQDHQTKGDQPFQALITEQIHVQPPSAPSSEFAPLQGRKVLVFSDSRQTAARLAPNLQTYSMQDVMRPLIVTGHKLLSESPRLGNNLSLEYLYFGVLLAANKLGVRLRPALRASEPFSEMSEVRAAVAQGIFDDDDALAGLAQEILVSTNPPHALLRSMVAPLTDRFYGLEALALASLCEAPKLTGQLVELPEISGFAESDEQKLALVRTWLRCWRSTGFHLRAMPPNWFKEVWGTHKGEFASMARFLTDAASRRAFKKEWLPHLLNMFAEVVSGTQHQLRGNKLSLLLSGDWAYCQRCRDTQRPYPGLQKCVNCGADTVEAIDPDENPVFQARKGYYRASTLAALDEDQQNPMALIAAEHTAQLNAAQSEEVFSKAEEYELLFQDIDLGRNDTKIGRTAIDILSCTTTMEVGIDIGALSGVALRTMPPARANYQQRAGRAGRRGTAVATVTAFGSADSHDEHYFRNPDQMIRGKVADPKLNVDNPDIARRHVTAFLLQRYHTDRLPNISPDEQPHLFAVLGTVEDFRAPDAKLNIDDFRQWLSENEQALHSELDDWLPAQLDDDERTKILDGFVEYTGDVVSKAIAPDSVEGPTKKDIDDDFVGVEVAEEEGEEQPITNPASEKLLDRLLFKGILPRYAFPTDVATFHVFNDVESTRFRPVFQYAPSQGLTTALSQYAPGKQVWIDGKLWTSGAVYSVMPQDRREAWESRTFYFECSVCHYSKTVRTADSEKGDQRDCPACGTSDSLGPARYWMRPPGFAHPIEIEEGTSPEDQPALSYATRAKLTAPITSSDSRWRRFNDRVQSLYLRDHLLVTNRGPKTEGYDYCVKCGRIEPAVGESTLRQPHRKPFPMENDQNCAGGATATGMVLGTQFITDVLLLSIDAPEPFSLKPGVLSTDIALRTVAEALTTAACDLLQLEHNELQAEYRPALSEKGQHGREAEIYLYDTLPGGAGFARRVEELGDQLLEKALEDLTGCPERCDRSCYRCLRSYRNKFEHDLLDRHLGATLLYHMLNGGEPIFSEERCRAVANRLFDDIEQHLDEGSTVHRDEAISVPDIGEVIVPILVKNPSGAEFVVAIHSGLTSGYLPTEVLRELCEFSLVPVLPIDETIVARHLPTATKKVLDFVNGS